MSAAIKSRMAIPFAVALALAMAREPAVAGANPNANVGTLAGLKLIDAQGEPYKPASDAAGTATLVGLWATWCPSCRSELPELIKIGHELGPKGVRLVLVSVDRTPEKAAHYLNRMGYSGEAAYDPGARSATRLGVNGIPTVILLDAAGRERQRVVGSGKEATARLRAEIAALIAARAEN